MQHFTFTLEDANDDNSISYGSVPHSFTTVSLHGEIPLNTLCDYFTQFVRGCGYILPENSKIGVTDEDF